MKRNSNPNANQGAASSETKKPATQTSATPPTSPNPAAGEVNDTAANPPGSPASPGEPAGAPQGADGAAQLQPDASTPPPSIPPTNTKEEDREEEEEEEMERMYSAMSSKPGLAWLREQLAAAERDERFGPGGSGWQYNETKRADIAERAEFLRALVIGVELVQKNASE